MGGNSTLAQPAVSLTRALEGAWGPEGGRWLCAQQAGPLDPMKWTICLLWGRGHMVSALHAPGAPYGLPEPWSLRSISCRAFHSPQAPSGHHLGKQRHRSPNHSSQSSRHHPQSLPFPPLEAIRKCLPQKYKFVSLLLWCPYSRPPPPPETGCLTFNNQQMQLYPIYSICLFLCYK